MKVLMTEYLRIDLEKETWECRVCNHEVGSAKKSYKEGMRVDGKDGAQRGREVPLPESSTDHGGCGRVQESAGQQ